MAQLSVIFGVKKGLLLIWQSREKSGGGGNGRNMEHCPGHDCHDWRVAFVERTLFPHPYLTKCMIN